MYKNKQILTLYNSGFARLYTKYTALPLVPTSKTIRLDQLPIKYEFPLAPTVVPSTVVAVASRDDQLVESKSKVKLSALDFGNSIDRLVGKYVKVVQYDKNVLYGQLLSYNQNENSFSLLTENGHIAAVKTYQSIEQLPPKKRSMRKEDGQQEDPLYVDPVVAILLNENHQNLADQIEVSYLLTQITSKTYYSIILHPRMYQIDLVTCKARVHNATGKTIAKTGLQFAVGNINFSNYDRLGSGRNAAAMPMYESKAAAKKMTPRMISSPSSQQEPEAQMVGESFVYDAEKNAEWRLANQQTTEIPLFTQKNVPCLKYYEYTIDFPTYMGYRGTSIEKQQASYGIEFKPQEGRPWMQGQAQVYLKREDVDEDGKNPLGMNRNNIGDFVGTSQISSNYTADELVQLPLGETLKVLGRHRVTSVKRIVQSQSQFQLQSNPSDAYNETVTILARIKTAASLEDDKSSLRLLLPQYSEGVEFKRAVVVSKNSDNISIRLHSMNYNGHVRFDITPLYASDALDVEIVMDVQRYEENP